MNANLDARISSWKKIQSTQKEVRSVIENKNKAVEEGLELTLKMSGRVVDLSQSETVSMSRRMQVTGQEAHDIALFTETAGQLEKEFALRCGKTYERLTKLSNSGDNERNPYS